MLHSIRNIFSKTLIIIWALQIINLSVYGNEYIEKYKDDAGVEHTQPNQIDSLTEYVAEVVLQHHNSFPEQHNNHTKNAIKTLKGSFHLFHVKVENILSNTINLPHPEHILLKENYHFLFCKEINPPPPKLS